MVIWYFKVIWCMLWPFGIFCVILVYILVFCTEKNLATLIQKRHTARPLNLTWNASHLSNYTIRLFSLTGFSLTLPGANITNSAILLF
jgi:hypothetical protein